MDEQKAQVLSWLQELFISEALVPGRDRQWTKVMELSLTFGLSPIQVAMQLGRPTHSAELKRLFG